MDVTPASLSSAQQAQTAGQAGALVMRKILDVMAQQGAEQVAMIAQAGNVGRNLDVTA